MSRQVTVTEQELAAACAEWDKQVKGHPGLFLSYAEVDQMTSDQYGKEAAVYLIGIIKQQQAKEKESK